MSREEMSNFNYRGARACILLHEKYIREFVDTWREFKGAGLPLPESRFSQYDSYEALLHHVVDLAGKYMMWTCEKLDSRIPVSNPVPV